MLATTTLTRAMVRLQMLCLEMQSLNDRSIKDTLLNEIIEYCVPLGYLEAFTIYGMDGNDAHLRMEVRIDYDEHEQQVKLSGDGVPDELAGDYVMDDGLGKRASGAVREEKHCPHMAKAVDLYIHLVKEKHLQLEWTVRFRERRAEMREKFGLVPSMIHDCTKGGLRSTVTNSLYSELTTTGWASTTILPHD